MKNTYKILSSFFFVFVVLLAVQYKANAQATLVTTDGTGTVTSFPVTAADVPVFIRTADHLENDVAAHEAAWTAWLAANQLNPGVRVPGMFIEIHQADFDAMPVNKKLAISANGIFHIIP